MLALDIDEFPLKLQSTGTLNKARCCTHLT